MPLDPDTVANGGLEGEGKGVIGWAYDINISSYHYGFRSAPCESSRAAAAYDVSLRSGFCCLRSRRDPKQQPPDPHSPQHDEPAALMAAVPLDSG